MLKNSTTENVHLNFEKLLYQQVRLMKKRIVVLGGSGFIGQYVVKQLCLKNWEVSVAARHFGSAQFLKTFGEVAQVAIFQTDIKVYDQVVSVMEGADAVINLVGILYPSGKEWGVVY